MPKNAEKCQNIYSLYMKLKLQQQLIYNTHILTAKHKMITNDNTMIIQ